MRIAFTQREMSYDRGGEERSLLALLKYLRKEGVECDLWYQRPGSMHKELKSYGVKLYQVPIQELSISSPLSFLGDVLHASAWLPKPDLIHVNSYKDITFAAALSIVKNVPLSLHLRLNAPPYLSKQYRLGFKRVAVAIANSDFVKRDWSTYGNSLKKIEDVHNGIDFSKFNLKPEKPKTEQKQILFIGRLLREKGIFEFIESVSLLEPELDVLALVAGDANTRKENEWSIQDYKSYLSEKKILSRFEFMGHSTNPIQLMKEADLVVIPSIFDSFGRTLMESLYSGTPTIFSYKGGSIDFVKKHDWLQKFTFDPENPVRIAEKIKAILQGDISYHSDKAISIAESEFSVQRTAENCLEIFKDVIHNK